MLLGNDGGKNVRVLEARGSGEVSVGFSSTLSLSPLPPILTACVFLCAKTVAYDLEVNFESDRSDAEAISDFAFVNDNVVVFASAFDNHVVIADLGQSPPQTHKLLLTDAEESTGGRLRSVEWAHGTKYVWVNGVDAGEHYVLQVDDDITASRVLTTIMDDTPSTRILWVENFQTRSNGADLSALGLITPTTTSNDDDDTDPIGIAALAIAAIALVVAIAAFALVLMGNRAPKASTSEEPVQEESKKLEDVKSLGSKQAV